MRVHCLVYLNVCTVCMHLSIYLWSEIYYIILIMTVIVFIHYSLNQYKTKHFKYMHKKHCICTISLAQIHANPGNCHSHPLIAFFTLLLLLLNYRCVNHPLHHIDPCCFSHTSNILRVCLYFLFYTVAVFAI